MFGFFEKKKKKSGAVKVVLICVAIAGAVSAAVAAFLLWKQKKDAKKHEAEAIDCIIDEELDTPELEAEETEAAAE